MKAHLIDTRLLVSRSVFIKVICISQCQISRSHFSKKNGCFGGITVSYTHLFLKLVVVALPLGAQDYGNSTTTGRPLSA